MHHATLHTLTLCMHITDTINLWVENVSPAAVEGRPVATKLEVVIGSICVEELKL